MYNDKSSNNDDCDNDDNNRSSNDNKSSDNNHKGGNDHKGDNYHQGDDNDSSQGRASHKFNSSADVVTSQGSIGTIHKWCVRVVVPGAFRKYKTTCVMQSAYPRHADFIDHTGWQRLKSSAATPVLPISLTCAGHVFCTLCVTCHSDSVDSFREGHVGSPLNSHK